MDMDMDRQVKKWVKRIKQSADKKSANGLVSHYFDEIYGYVFKRASSEEIAMDITQEIFVSMLQSIDHYDQRKSSFRTWLYQIVKRRIADYYRSKDYQEDRVIGINEEFEHNLQSSLVSAEKRVELAEIEEFIDRLDSQSREIFRLKIFEKCTFSCIAGMLDMPESTVKANFYATQRLVKEVFLWKD